MKQFFGDPKWQANACGIPGPRQRSFQRAMGFPIHERGELGKARLDRTLGDVKRDAPSLVIPPSVHARSSKSEALSMSHTPNPSAPAAAWTAPKAIQKGAVVLKRIRPVVTIRQETDCSLSFGVNPYQTVPHGAWRAGCGP